MEKVKYFLDERIENFIPDFRNALRDIYDVLMDLKDDSNGISDFTVVLVGRSGYEDFDLFSMKSDARKIIDVSTVKGRCLSLGTPHLHIKISIEYKDASKVDVDNLITSIDLIINMLNMTVLKSNTIYRATTYKSRGGHDTHSPAAPREESIRYKPGVSKSEIILKSNYKRDHQTEINFEKNL